MRSFVALLSREWRDARAVTVAAAIVAVLASVAVNEWFVHYRDGALMATWVVPALLGLYVAVIASDLVAADVATRRIDALALLPAGMLRVWTAKAVFALLAGAAFLAWLVAAELAILSVGGGPNDVGAFLAALPDALPNLGVVVLALAAVLFFSTLFDRGFAAVLAGTIVVAAGVYAWHQADWAAWQIRGDAAQMGTAALGAALVFLGASAAAFVRGPAHGAALRRALVGFAVPLGVFVPVGVGSAVALDRWLTLDPGSPDGVAAAVYPSADGSYVALRVEKRGHYASSYLWIVRTDDGRLVTRPDPNLDVEGWSDDGLVRAWTYRGASPWRDSRRSERTQLVSFDPATGELVRTRSIEQVTAEMIARWRPAQPRTIVLKRDGTRTVRDAATGREEPLAEADAAHPWVMASPHARYARVSGRGGSKVVDLADRRVVVSTGGGAGLTWVRNRDDDRFALLYDGSNPTYLLDLETGRRVEIVPNPNGYGAVGDGFAAVPGDRFVILRRDGSVDLIDAECRTVRRVWPPAK